MAEPTGAYVVRAHCPRSGSGFAAGDDPFAEAYEARQAALAAGFTPVSMTWPEEATRSVAACLNGMGVTL
jgi:hypothetical protein